MSWSPDDTYDSGYEPYDEGIYLLERANHAVATADRPRNQAKQPRKESFSNNLNSDRTNIHSIYDESYEPWPLRYNPGAGPEWSNLVPRQSDRPWGGGWAPSLAFPIPKNPPFGRRDFIARGCGGERDIGCDSGCGGEGRERFGGKVACTPEMTTQYIKIFLMVVIIVLLAISITIAFKLSRGIEKTIKTAIKVLGEVASQKKE